MSSAAYVSESYRAACMTLLCSVSREFEDLLHEKAPLDAYTDWLDSIVNRCIILVRTATREYDEYASFSSLITFHFIGCHESRDFSVAGIVL